MYEAAFVMHPEVCEALIPNPMSGSNGLSFDPVNYRGKFDWKNIANEITNPDGTIGFFRGVLASATKPIKTEFGLRGSLQADLQHSCRLNNIITNPEPSTCL